MTGAASSVGRSGEGPRLLVVSDVHGNLAALDAVLREPHEGLICLGDIVGYGPEPAGCVDRIRDECAIVVQGNHDRGFADGVPVRSSAAFRWLAAATAPIAERQLDANPGSVGQPKDGDWRAAYAVVDRDGGIALRRCPYDVERTVRGLRQAGIAAAAVDALAALLRTGAVQGHESAAGKTGAPYTRRPDHGLAGRGPNAP